MQPERWIDTVSSIKDKFEVDDFGQAHEDEEGGIDIEFIEFKTPVGRIRLEYITRPVILDKKTIYSQRLASETKVNYVYSANEKSHQMVAYKWNENDDEWEEIESKNFIN